MSAAQMIVLFLLWFKAHMNESVALFRAGNTFWTTSSIRCFNIPPQNAHTAATYVDCELVFLFQCRASRNVSIPQWTRGTRGLNKMFQLSFTERGWKPTMCVWDFYGTMWKCHVMIIEAEMIAFISIIIKICTKWARKHTVIALP